MTTTLNIDLVSDISCPWCLIGYKSLERALAALAPEIDANIQWRPFELNPDMPAEGQNLAEHVYQKYGMTAEQSQSNRAQIRSRGAELGVEFNYSDDSRIYNTFDAHRLLYWARGQGKQHQLKMALFQLFFTQGGNPSDHHQLIEAAADAGLDGASARELLDSSRYTDEVRQELATFANLGVRSVPTIIVNEQYAIGGAQSAEAFEQALREIAADRG